MNKKWYACELHCHTRHSDGDFTVRELIETAAERHLDGIQLTDHNTNSGHAETEKAPIAVLKSIEWTTYFGHMHAMDCKEYVDWRDAQPDNIDEKMKEAINNNPSLGTAQAAIIAALNVADEKRKVEIAARRKVDAQNLEIAQLRQQLASKNAQNPNGPLHPKK